jgi:putative hemolysin
MQVLGMLMQRRGRFAARFAGKHDDVARAQRLRWQAFRAPIGAPEPLAQADGDAFDPLCRHVLIEEVRSGALVGCFRLMSLASGSDLERSYTAQHYDLRALRIYPGRFLEIGRFCLHPAWHDPDILRLAWGMITAVVDAEAIALLFGCSSFRGTDAARHHEAFALLKQRHLAPMHWRPGRKAPEIFSFENALPGASAEPRAGMAGLPPLLRSYLAMGGRVSDHAVIDHELQTLHVFTGLEVSAVPAARARLLRAAAAQLGAGSDGLTPAKRPIGLGRRCSPVDLFALRR